MLPPEIPPNGSEDSLDTVAMIADALNQKFGAAALDVAKRQQGLAGDDAVAKWDEVIARLRS